MNALTLGIGIGRGHTQSIAFRHLPPNSARFGYATEGALFISAAQLSKVFGYCMTVERSNLAPKHARKHEKHPTLVKERVRLLDSNYFGFI